MARRTTYGTSTRSEHYLRPRPALGLTLVAVLVLGAVAAVFLAAELAGLRAPLSPGRVSERHATWDARCRECHVARQGVPNLRCQRCHDPGVGGRLDHSAHVLFGSLDEKKAAGCICQAKPILPNWDPGGSILSMRAIPRRGLERR